ncbi:MAG: hypothetical protein L6Q99_15050 [Planctomycetes bacterium]|nr:hypothetical protein [Planctomycetota bacterium]
MSGEYHVWIERLSTAVRVSAVAALVALIAEFGFRLEDAWLERVHWVELGVTALLALATIARFAVAADKRRHFAEHRVECLLVTVFLGCVVASSAFGEAGVGLRWVVILAQVYLVFAAVLTLARANEALLRQRVRPELALVGSFVLLILVGAALFMLPAVRADGAREWSWSDALFTSTSAVCVTGLSVRDVAADLSFRGQALLLALIQLGGLGLVGLAAAVSVFQRRSLRLEEAGALQALLGVEDLGSLRRFLQYMLAITLAVELVGAVLLWRGAALPADAPGGGWWWACFHSVSAFCNAGFGLHADSLVGRAGDPFVLGVLGAAIVIGGLGYPVWTDLLRYRVTSLAILRRARWHVAHRLGGEVTRLALHTKLTLSTVGVLLVGGTLVFWLSEKNGVLGGFDPVLGWVNAAFQSVTLRTAGFNSIDLGLLATPTLLFMMVWMAIGASPLSTGGGIKTSAIAVVFHMLRAMLKNREQVDAFGRSLPRGIVNAAVSVVALYAAAVLVFATALMATQSGVAFLDVLFETISALSTVGLSRGVTAAVDDTGRVILCAAMLVGRVGPIALLWTLFSRGPSVRYEYPSEKMVVA